MSNTLIDAFKKSLETGFIDNSVASEVLYQPELLVNTAKPPKKVLTSIIQELENCDEFLISVAFVTTGGVAALINTLKLLEERGIRGKILVSQYLNFTQPEALRRLLQFKNIELRIAVNSNSHSKGYIFRVSECYNLIIGSSNLTQTALATNKEWNLKVSALKTSAIANNVVNEFNLDFSSGIPVTQKYILKYEEVYKKQLISYRIDEVDNLEDNVDVILPNLMQKEALLNIKKLRNENKNKALLISATGTGKTYLSAFDVKQFGAKKLLFVVHRLNIAKAAMKSFKKIFGNEKSMGVYSGNEKEIDKDFIFSTIQTISKESHLKKFNKSHFDYLIIDESHRSGADSYLRLIEYFEPKFLLGMTATPERTDGNDIFKLFGHNIAYEIRLHRAMEENMLCPFHYYGVTDLSVDGEIIEKDADFRLLLAGERVDRILEKIKFYGTDNGVVRGLIFCSRNEEAELFSKEFNQRGYKTTALTGDNIEEERVDAINLLESNDFNEKLDYIFTVDIFNEGIDIPRLNQVVMIRPTASAIVFVQQLGRGLRKTHNKEYLTVIDFIGNYKNNYLVPIALYGDTSYNKDALRKLIFGGSRSIPGVSTINFDKISKDRIYASIDSSKMKLLSDLSKDYNLLKNRLGRIPMMMDFIENGSRDPYLYVEYSKSYLNFVIKQEKGFDHFLNKKALKLLEFFSREINNGKRVEEAIILKNVFHLGSFSIQELKDFVKEKYKYNISHESISSFISNINFEFVREKKNGKLVSINKIYNTHVIKIEGQVVSFTDEFNELMKSSVFKSFFIDSVEYSIHLFSRDFDPSKWVNGFHLYRKYSRKDVFRILNFSENPVAQNVGGYLVKPDNNSCPIFVNYHKEDDISESTKYEDEFINNKEFNWMSKSNRKIDSPDVQSILGERGKIRLPLFIKKNNDEGKEFYFISDINPHLTNVVESKMNNDNGKKVSVVKISFDLEIPVLDEMYDYLCEKLESKNDLKIIDIESKNLGNSLSENVEESKIEIPFYNFYAAAGLFSEMQSEKEYQLIEVPQRFGNSEDYFACKVIGESMNKIIPNGATCIFKHYTGGSRNGKVVLVENLDRQDPDFNSAFTVKTYYSEKSVTEEDWGHELILLKPNSFDSGYNDIEISEENASDMRIVGEFVQVLNI